MKKTPDHQAAKHCCAVGVPGSGRVRLPIAPKAQARLRFSPEKPLPRALSPDQALNWLSYLKDQGHELKVINLGGPGDPLATPHLSMQVLQLLKKDHPQASLCLTTLGLGASVLAAEFAKMGLAHVSILMDAVEPEAAQGIYSWIRPGVKNLPLSEASGLLIGEQAGAVEAFKAHGVPVLIKTTVYAGVNVTQIEKIALKAAQLGADGMKLFPFVAPADDCPQPCGELSQEQLEALAASAARHLPAELMLQAYCEDDELYADPEPGSAALLPKPSREKPHLAVCSADGFEVDLHLGQAGQYLIYGPKEGLVSLLETHPAPEPGGGDSRWKETAMTLSDCFAVLAVAAGERPKSLLAERGLAVISQEGNVEGLVDVLFGGGKKKGPGKGRG